MSTVTPCPRADGLKLIYWASRTHKMHPMISLDQRHDSVSLLSSHAAPLFKPTLAPPTRICYPSWYSGRREISALWRFEKGVGSQCRAAGYPNWAFRSAGLKQLPGIKLSSAKKTLTTNHTISLSSIWRSVPSAASPIPLIHSFLLSHMFLGWWVVCVHVDLAFKIRVCLNGDPGEPT